MAKAYRIAQQWEHWLTQFLGRAVLEAEKKVLLPLLASYYGKYALLIGVPQQNELLQTSATARQVLLTPLMVKEHKVQTVESELHELPMASGSIDLVILPHTLEHIENPHHLIMEACRIVKPEGHIVILGFNPASLWGLKKPFVHGKNMLAASLIKKWLQLADFELIKQDMLLFRPPIQRHAIYKKLNFLEWFGHKFYRPLGGAYVLVARAKVIPLTPIRMRWQQKLSGVHASISGPTMRDF